jgi:tetratricopeptide (TPR) repeat protein
MTDERAEPRFLSPAGEQAWVRIRRHLDRANRFWLAVILTENTLAADILRERVQGNRRLRAERFVELRPRTPAEFTAMVESFEQQATAPAGCTMVIPPLTPAVEWLDEWRRLLYLLNHRRDTLRRRLGGVVLVAPPAVKTIAQRETTDLWSIVDLLVELPSVTSAGPPDRQAELQHEPPDTPPGISVGGLSLGDAPEHLLDEASALLALPRDVLATTSRARATTAIHRAHDNGANQLAAVLLLAQADSYQQAGDRAAALDLLRSALQLVGVDRPTRIRLVDSAAELAFAMGDVDIAAEHASESVELEQSRVDQLGTPEALRDLSISLNKLADIDYARGDLDAARTGYTRSLELRERLATQLGTPSSFDDLRWSLERLADVATELGDTDHAAELRLRAEEVGQRAAQSVRQTRRVWGKIIMPNASRLSRWVASWRRRR